MPKMNAFYTAIFTLAGLSMTFSYAHADRNFLEELTDQQCRSEIIYRANQVYSNHEYAEHEYSWSAYRSKVRLENNAESRDDSIAMAASQDNPCDDMYVTDSFLKFKDLVPNVLHKFKSEFKTVNEKQSKAMAALKKAGNNCIKDWNNDSFDKDANALKSLNAELEAKVDALQAKIGDTFAKEPPATCSEKAISAYEKSLADKAPLFADAFKDISAKRAGVDQLMGAFYARYNKDFYENKFDRSWSCPWGFHYEEPANKAFESIQQTNFGYSFGNLEDLERGAKFMAKKNADELREKCRHPAHSDSQPSEQHEERSAE